MTFLTSCDTFWQGMGNAGYGYSGYGMGGYQMFPGYMPPPTPPTAQQILNSAAQQVERQNQQEDQAAKRYRPNLTYQQFLTEKANAYEMTKNSSSGYSSTTTSSSSSKSSSSTLGSSSRSNNTSSRDCRLCLGTGKCKTCNGDGYYYNPLDLTKTILCPNCQNNHNGKCSSCGGTGKK
jgi:hypothetical protein